MLWRGALFGLGLRWFACAGADAYRIVTEGGLLAWMLGVLHAVVFSLLGAGTCVVGVFVDGPAARSMLGEFAGAVFLRKNLRGVAAVLALATVAALVLAQLNHH